MTTETPTTPTLPDAPADDTPAPIEIELTADEIAAGPPVETPATPAAETPPAPAAETPPEPPAEERKKKAPAHVRLAREKQRAEEAEQREAQALDRAAAAEAIVAAERRASVIHYEARVKVETERAQERLQAAITKGDAAAQASASLDLAKWAGETTSINAWKSANPAPAAAPTQIPQAPQRPQTQQTEAAPPVTPELRAWISENPWFDVEHDDFDEDMHVEAVLFAQSLERKYKRLGRDSEIGSKKYFDEVMAHQRAEFPDHFPKPGRTPPMTGSSAVAAPAPASGGAAPVAAAGTKIVLTGDEAKMAAMLPLQHPDGRDFTVREKQIAYWNGKQKAARDAAARKAA